MYILIHIYRSLYVYITASRAPLPRPPRQMAIYTSLYVSYILPFVGGGPPDKWQYIRLFMYGRGARLYVETYMLIYICVGLFMYILMHIYRSLYVYIKDSRAPLPRRHVRHDPPDKWQYIRLFMYILICIYSLFMSHIAV